jgi:hypothetical protein
MRITQSMNTRTRDWEALIEATVKNPQRILEGTQIRA